MEAIASSARTILRAFVPRDLSISAWAYAAWGFADAPLLASIAASSLPIRTDFEPRSLSNTAWAFSTRRIVHRPLFDALAAEALKKIRDFDEQACANTAFAFSALGCRHNERVLNSTLGQSMTLVVLSPEEFGPWHQLLDVVAQLAQSRWTLAVEIGRAHV